MQEKASSKSAGAAAEAQNKATEKGVITMRLIYFPAWLLVIVSLSACASIQSAGAIAQGRQALFEGNNQAALGYFQAAAQVDPNYLYGTELQEGTLSFLGRAQYLNGDYTRARSTLEKALAQHKDDNVARLYLGLTLARQGETQKSLQDIDAGMEGIYDFLTDSVRFSFGKEWDPGRDIRSAIERDRAMIASGKIDWPALIADGESIAMKIEREPDLRKKPTVHD
jgi:tetratricopeptide (TPR) repeat protein